MHGAAPVAPARLVLEIVDVSKAFDGFVAISHVSFTLRPGTITAIIGPNGAGKSTLFNLITGSYIPDSGEVMFDGVKITKLPPHRLSRMGLGCSFQRTNVFAKLSVFENVQAALIARHGAGRRLFVASR